MANWNDASVWYPEDAWDAVLKMYTRGYLVRPDETRWQLTRMDLVNGILSDVALCRTERGAKDHAERIDWPTWQTQP